jgi:NAD(P)H-flavin reductase
MFMATTIKKQIMTEDRLVFPMVPQTYQVHRIQRETHDTFTIGLSTKDKVNGFHFTAGQFNMLYLFGVGEVPISISGNPTDPKMLVHTVRAVGPVSNAISKLHRGDFLGVRGPFGTSWPLTMAAGNDVLVIAGGIGLAPLRPTIYQLLAQREKYGKIILLYGTRTPADILYRHELERWRARFDVEVHITVDRAMTGWRGNVGVVTTLIPKSSFDPSNTVAMVCGPEIMMRFSITELMKRGVVIGNIFVSMERNMKCGIGLCGHCQYGPTFICKDGPVFPYDRIKELFATREI